MTQAKDTFYQGQMSRRQSLKLFAMLAASAAVPGLAGCSKPATRITDAKGAGHWPDMTIAPIDIPGYGQDPNLIMPPKSPWPRTLLQSEMDIIARLSDILVPSQTNQPGALATGVPDVVDEWVSAPYSQQQRDRDTILRLLTWLDDEAQLSFDQPFMTLSSARQMTIVDKIAFGTDKATDAYQPPAAAFDRLRELVLAAYFCSEPGSRDIGYMGNVAINGDYPGPTANAMAHLDNILKDLGLTEYAYKVEHLV